MKKILLLTALLVGFISNAQVPVYIQNTTGFSGIVMVEARGANNMLCNQRLSAEVPVPAGTTVVLNSFNSLSTGGGWVKAGTTTIYSPGAAQSLYGQADWTAFRYRPDPPCTGCCGNMVIEDCYGGTILTSLTNGCGPNMSWTNYGSYILILLF